MYNTGKELLEITIKRNTKISNIVIEYESELQEKPISYIREKMKERLKIMFESSSYALNNDIKSVSGLSGGDAKKVEEYRKKGKTLSGDIIVKAIARAMSTSEVNAAMGKIVAAPTAGSSGIIPAAIVTAAEVLSASEDEMVNALFTASGIGQIIAKNATVSGAQGGCQAECGSAAAMAAAALVEMYGGTPQMSLDAASISLKNVLGLVCDPVAGLVEHPCIKRNAIGVVNAFISADIALAGVKSIIPFDEVVDAMYKVGNSLPTTLKETALGGIAATETGKTIASRIS